MKISYFLFPSNGIILLIALLPAEKNQLIVQLSWKLPWF